MTPREIGRLKEGQASVTGVTGTGAAPLPAPLSHVAVTPWSQVLPLAVPPVTPAIRKLEDSP